MGTNSVSEFKLDNKGLKAIKLIYLKWLVAIFAILTMFCVFDTNPPVIINNVRQTGIAAILGNIITLFILFTICLFIQQLSIRRRYSGMIIRVNDQMIELTVPRQTIKLFYLAEITRVARTAPGEIHLYSKGQRITIIKQIDQYDELASLLIKRFPSLTNTQFTFYQKYFPVLAFIAFALFLSILVFDNKILLSVNGLILLGMFLIDLGKRYKSYKIVKLKGLRNAIIYELFLIALEFYYLIPKLMK